MGNLSSSIGVQSSYPKARQFARSPVLFASIQLGKNLQGFILNASEGGVCVQTAREIVGDEPLDLRFQSVRPGAWVNARGRIVWKNESNTVAGLQFIDADKEIAGEVRNWLNFGESLQELRGDWWPDSQPQPVSAAASAGRPETTPIVLSPRLAVPIEMPAPISAAAALPDYSSFEDDEESIPVESPKLTLVESNSPRHADPHEQETDTPVIGFQSQEARNQRHAYDYVRPSAQEEHRNKFVIASIAGIVCVLILAGWFVFGHKGPNAAATTSVVPSPSISSAPLDAPAVTKPAATHSDSAVAAVQPTAVQPAHPSIPKPVVSTAPVAAAPLHAVGPPGTVGAPSGSGFVLQVAAMSEEANANKLASSLKTGHLPAFVSKHEGDRFYRVLVGPFSNETPLREAADNLKKNGYDSIEKHWSP